MVDACMQTSFVTRAQCFDECQCPTEVLNEGREAAVVVGRIPQPNESWQFRGSSSRHDSTITVNTGISPRTTTYDA